MPTQQVNTVDTVIVGAGPAGLAIAARLSRAQRPFVILEQAQQVGASWRGHYDRLHLHSSKRFSRLPGQGFPAAVPRYPSRDELINYLEDYARRFGLAPRFGVRVLSIAREEGGWVTVTPEGRYRSQQVVIATGNTRRAHRPHWPGEETFGGPIIHSSAYRNGREFAGKDVLVIGLGNTGGDIADDLCEHGARAVVAVRSPLSVVPRDFLGLPILVWSLVLDRFPVWLGDAVAKIVSRLSFGRLERLGLRTRAQGPIAQMRRGGGVPFLDHGTLARIRRGEVGVRPDVAAFAPGLVRFSDGTEERFDAVVLATGYRPALEDFVDPALALPYADLWQRSGTEVRPGLFVCGFRVTPTGMLREIGREARRIARAITRTATQRA